MKKLIAKLIQPLVYYLFTWVTRTLYPRPKFTNPLKQEEYEK